jgi:hypothetical protein
VQAEAQRADLSRDLEAIGDRISPGRMVERRKAAVQQGFGRARDAVMGRADSVRSSAGDTLSGVGDTASSVGQRIGDVPGAVRQQTEGNPIAAGVIAFGAGMLLATLIPATRREEEVARRIEPQLAGVAGEVRSGVQQAAEQLKPAAQQAMEEVKSSARDAVDTVKGEASSGADTVRQEAGTAAGTVTDAVKGSGSAPSTSPQSTPYPTSPPS